jgi:hypothetical protein
MDGRNVSLFADEMVLENLKFYSDDPSHVDIDAPLRYATDFLLIPTEAPVLSRVLADSRWRRMYADADSVLFEHADAGATRPELLLARRPVTSQTVACSAILK